ncbi:MAG: hypothetical protein QME96_03570 [Myxococcota bacterium]|nr:hypothetical protein [Myxococcota bacterium]
MRFALACLPTLTIAACGARPIPNTEVEDTPDNRAVIEFCERYRLAIEAVDVPLIVSLAADDYYEPGNPTTGEDDYDRGGLEEVLRTRFARVDAIRYDILYRRIHHGPDRVEVLYTYHGRFQVTRGDQDPVWHSKVGDNRLVLVRTPAGFRISGGM